MAEEKNTQSVEETTNIEIVANQEAPIYTGAPIIITQPGDNMDMPPITVEPGQTYIFDFEPDVVKSTYEQDGDLLIKFSNNSSVTLKDFEGALGDEFPPALTLADGTVISPTELITTLSMAQDEPDEELLEKPQAEIRTAEVAPEADVSEQVEADTQAEQVAKIEPAAGEEETAERVAEIEPAAGDDGNSNTGYGIQSRFAAGPINPIEDVGPIDPTQLQYGVEFQNDTLLPDEDEPQGPRDDSPEAGDPIERSIDETNLGPISISDQLDFDFGNDGPGSVMSNNSFSESGSLLGGNLTSNGVPVIVSDTGTGYEGFAGGTKVFDIVIDDPITGDFTFTQFEQLDHNDPNDPNDIITLTFGFDIKDSDNDLVTTEVIVNVADDIPSIEKPATEMVDEDNLGGPTAVNGSIVHDFGEDGAGSIEPDGTSGAGGDLEAGVLSSGGVPVIISQTADGYEGVAGATPVFDITIDPSNGDFIFTLHEPLDHSDPGDVIMLSFGVQITDFDGDTDQTTVMIEVKDDGPRFVDEEPEIGAGIESIDETNLGPIVVGGSLNVDFGGDGPGGVTPDGSFFEGGSLLGGNLTSNSVPVIVTANAGGYVGQAGGMDVFTLTVNPANGDYEFTLIKPLDHADPNDPNDVISLVFGVQIEDSDGDSDTGTITIIVADDIPSIVKPPALDVDEDNLSPAAVNGTVVHDFGEDGAGSLNQNGTSSAGGDLEGGVLSSNGVPVIISATPGGYVGMAGATPVFEITIDGNTGDYEFTLLEPLDHSNPGDTITLNFGVEVEDFDGDTVDTDIVINVIDDRPEFPGQPDIGSGIENIDETNLGPINVAGSLNVDFGNDGAGAVTIDGNFAEGGSLLGGNLTHNGTPIVVSPVGTSGYEGFAGGIKVFEITVNPANGDYSFTQFEQLDHNDPNDPNDVISLQFGVQIVDNDGDTASGTITVNVADDAVTANDDFNNYNVADGGTDGNVVTGLNGGPGAADDLSEDVDNTVTQVSFGGNPAVIIPDGGSNTVNGDFGQLELFSDGTYTYTLFPNPGGSSTSLNPVEGDVSPQIADSFTKNGITVSTDDGSDLTWVPTDGNGIGVAGGSDKVWPSGETIEVEFAASDVVLVTLADIGQNNLDDSIDFNVYLASDPNTAVPFLFDIGTTVPVNGRITIELSAADFGDQIVGFDVFSTTEPASFILNDVEIVNHAPECLQDQFEYTLQDGDFDTDTALLTLKGGFPPVDVRLEVNNAVDDVQVKEDGSVFVPVTAGYAGGNGNETLTLTLDGVDPSWGFVGAGWVPTGNPGEFELVLPVGQQNYNDGFTFSPPAESDLDLNGLNVTATVSGPNPGDSASTSDGFNITTDAVADDPSIVADDDMGAEGATLDVDVVGMLGTDNFDGSESITGYQISGVPLNGFSFNQGADQGGGTWAFTPAQIIGLTITPDDPNFSGMLNLTAKVLTTENPVSDGEFDLADNNNEATDPFKLTWKPQINPPEIEVNNGVEDVCVKEDGTVDVPITAVLGANPAQGEFLTVEVTGIDPAWGTFFAPIGNYNPGTQTWSITLAPGASLNTVFTFTPNPDSDIDLTGMVATATATDPGPNPDLTAQATDSFNVIVDAVADVPNLNTSNANGEEGSLISLTVSTSVNDTDGSEVIEAIKISDLPPGATLTAGVENAGVWTLTPAELVGLGINVPDGVTGSFTLKVETVAFEQNTNGIEKDLTDNRASAFGEIVLRVTPDDDPVLVQPEEVTVDETNLAPTTMISDSIQANFGADTPGSFSGNGGFFSGIALTSDGVPVNVGFNAGTGTYTGSAGGDTIFTLKIESNGDYKFTLEGVLDHPDTNDHNDNIPMEFGITATDSDGDTDTGIITVNVLDDGLTAHDDMNMFNTDDGGTDGNVVSGANGGPGAADDLSNDMPNTVTKVSFGATVKDVPDGGSITIDGDFGELEIFSDGTYNYTLFNDALVGEQGEMFHLDPVASDANGQQTSITKDGVTVTVANQGNFDISWVDTSAGSGLGIDNLDTGDSTKIWPAGEAFDISFAEDVSKVTIKIAELGDNNDDGNHGVDYIVTLADGTTVVGEQQFVPNEINNGMFEFTLNASDFGDLIESVNISSTNDGDYDAASMLLNNVWAETEGTPVSETHDVFNYTLTDNDGDSSVAELALWGAAPKLIVGRNVDDVEGSQVPHLVNGDEGIIMGMKGNDILVGDAGGSFREQQNQDFNFVFILDASGSMGSNTDANSKISILADAVENLMQQFDDYQTGNIVVHMVSFSTNVKDMITIDFSDADALSDAINFLDNLDGSGLTNYESPMQDALGWLNGPGPINGSAITTTYFISDDQPNRYADDNGNAQNPPGNNAEEEAIILAELTGTDVTTSDGTFGDNTDEIGGLQSFGEVIAIGVDIPVSDADVLDEIATGDAIVIDDPMDLDDTLQNTNPLNLLAAAGGDELQGKDGDEIIFGDVLFTDDLASAEGLPTNGGAGWEVFERLENGEGNTASWDRDDTIAYIRANAVALSEESEDSQGEGRTGGDDIISGGAGNDLIFGQEGDDVINGGSGNDELYGGSGADAFLYEALLDGLDTIKDFDLSEGDLLDISALLTQYNPIQDSINDFVFKTENAGDTTISIDENGSGNIANATAIAMLEGITGLDLELATNDGQVVV